MTYTQLVEQVKDSLRNEYGYSESEITKLMSLDIAEILQYFRIVGYEPERNNLTKEN